MTTPPAPLPATPQPQPNLFGILRPYRGFIALLVLLAILSNGLNLTIPLLLSHGIDAYAGGTLDMRVVILQFSVVVLFIFLFTYLQSMVQTYASERVARDMRRDLAAVISRQNYASVERLTPSVLLTNLTSDIDAVKLFVSQAIVSIVSSVFIILGSSVLLLLTNWRLALVVLLCIPLIGGTFFAILRQVRLLFRRGQEVIDWLNRVINESILASSLIRVLHSQQREYDKFLAANSDALDIGMKILRLFAAMIPIITFIANMATLAILALGGSFVISGSMTLGQFAAFNSYLGILIFPIIIIGFMSNVIARASASYKRVGDVLQSPPPTETGTVRATLRGDIAVREVSLSFGQKHALKDVSFAIKAGTKTAIIGPTAAGKTQLLNVLTGLTLPQKGMVEYDGRPLAEYDPASFHSQVAVVFQDSVLFNLSIRENIAFSALAKDPDLEKAIATAELRDFVDSLPGGLETIVSERGSSLSGGQKQRLMLARALALNPRILLLDDFTARVDTTTERSILANLATNYPALTLVSVTQKIASAEHYDQILLLMEGELLASGTHEQLLSTSPEYAQIADSQRSTNAYELRAA